MTVKPVCDYAWVRETTIGQLLDLIGQHGQRVSEEEWELLRSVLVEILDCAAGFYDDFDHRHYEFALNVAAHVLEGSPPEKVIRAMAGTAHFMLNPLDEEPKEFSAEPRARLERIRDADPEFAE
jgi:hypothetical protein